MAVKTPLQGIEFSPAELSRFRAEGERAARLDRDGIVRVFDVGEHEGRVYIVYQLIDGCSLRELLANQKLDLLPAVSLLRDIALVVEHAHQQGVVHRDLKPGNILIDKQGRPQVVDFGMAKVHTIDQTIANPGMVVGTPGYMAPEQAAGNAHDVDRRADLYSLGVILYELITGQRPFKSTASDLLKRIQFEPPTPPSRHNDAVPAELEAICLKAMAKQPQDRYQSASEFAGALAEFLTSAGAAEETAAFGVLPHRTPGHMPGRTPGHKWGAVACAVCLLLLATGFAVKALLPQPPAAVPAATQAAALPLPIYPVPDEAVVHNVSMTTDPPGAQLLFYRLDDSTRNPRPDHVFKPAERSPATVELPAGDYFVVAVLDDGRFHEVLRRVPVDLLTLSESHPHRSWRREREMATVELPKISIPDAAVTERMARFEGGSAFTMGTEHAALTELPHWNTSVAPFFLDVQEVSYGDFRAANNGKNPRATSLQDGPPDENLPARVWWDDAVAHAERVGKRLMTEIEYEFAATRGGTTRFPWGDDAGVITEWSIGPVGTPVYDRTDTVPPVFGLFSNAAEWTSTHMYPYPPALEMLPSAQRPYENDYVGFYVLRGAPRLVINGEKPRPEDWEVQGPRLRVGNHVNHAYPGVGFRCARSARPHLIPEDFHTHVRPK